MVRIRFAGGTLAGIMSAASAILAPALAADSAAPQTAIPQFMGPGVSFVSQIIPFDDFLRLPRTPQNLAMAKTFNEWPPPPSGIGPITADPAYPFRNNEVAAQLGLPPTFRVADLNNEAGKNLKPWAVEALKKARASVLAGRDQ